MDIEIREATLRDLSYVCANAIELDKEEILAAGPRTLTECAVLTHYFLTTVGGFGRVVWVDGNPEFCFGFNRQSELMPWLFSAWAWGTEKKALCMPEISRWARAEIIGLFDEWGVKRIEARASAHHYDAHRWLEWMNFKRECELPEWGRDGMNFVQYAWLRSDHVFGPYGNVVRKGKSNGRTFSSSAAAPATADD